MLETVRDLAGRAARFETRPAEMEVSGQDEVPPPPPAVHYPHVPTAPSVMRTYEMPPSQMPTVATVPLSRPSGCVPPQEVPSRQFVVGESSGTQSTDGQIWEVRHFLKNGGEIFYGSTNPEVALDWLETVRVVLTHI